MKGKTILTLAIALSLMLSVVPLVAVKASPTTMEIVFENGLNEITKAYDSFFVATLHITATPNITQWIATISWDPSILEIVNPDTDIVEGPFLKSVGATMFAVKPLEPGLIPEMFSMLMVAKSKGGSGDLAYITFHAKGFGDSAVHIDVCTLLNGLNVVPCDPVHGLVHVPPPSPTPPKAIFTPLAGETFYVCTNITLDGSASTDGIDTWPIPPGIENEPITEWKWEIDVGNDLSIEETLYGETQVYHCSGPGIVAITLTVTAPDLTPPTLTYVDHNSAKHVINQIVKPLGPAIDVYTIVSTGTCPPPYVVYGGLGPIGPYPFGWSDAYGPQEEVCVAAKVTYNDEPVEYKPVGFEMIDKNGDSVDYRVAFTDANGIAVVCFRIPWAGHDAELLFGDWSVVGTVDVAGTIVTDTVKFRFGYILSIVDIIVTGSPLYKGDTMTIDIDIQSISMSSRDAFVTVVACDECGVPIGLDTAVQTVDPEDGISLGYSITIPSWAFVGTGNIYVNLFTAAPSAGGVPYCPEDSTIFIILKTP